MAERDGLINVTLKRPTGERHVAMKRSALANWPEVWRNRYSAARTSILFGLIRWRYARPGEWREDMNFHTREAAEKNAQIRMKRNLMARLLFGFRYIGPVPIDPREAAGLEMTTRQ